MQTEEKSLRSTNQNVFEKAVILFKSFFMRKKDKYESLKIEYSSTKKQFEDNVKINTSSDGIEELFKKLVAGEISTRNLSDGQIVELIEVCQKKTNDLNKEIAEKSRRFDEIEKRINEYVDN